MGWFYDTRCIHNAYVEREVEIRSGSGRLKKGREERGEIYIMPLWKEREREGWKSLIEGAGEKGNWRPVSISAALYGIGIDITPGFGKCLLVTLAERLFSDVAVQGLLSLKLAGVSRCPWNEIFWTCTPQHIQGQGNRFLLIEQTCTRSLILQSIDLDNIVSVQLSTPSNQRPRYLNLNTQQRRAKCIESNLLALLAHKIPNLVVEEDTPNTIFLNQKPPNLSPRITK